MTSDLTLLVIKKIEELGDEGAAAYFSVSKSTVASWRNRASRPHIMAAQKVLDEAAIAPELPEDNEKASLQVLLPIYDDPTPLNHITLLANYRHYGVDKINILTKLRTLIDEARNDLAHRAMQKNQSKYVLFVDSDMVLPVGNAKSLHKHGWPIPERLGNRMAIERIMSHPPEYRIVGGLYRDRRVGRQAQTEKAYRSKAENDRLIGIMDGRVNDDGLEENRWVATGFMRVDISVFHEMAAEAKPGGKLADIAPPAGRENEPIGFFGRTSQWRGEDIAFCRRAGLLGIKTYCDVGCVLGHAGTKIY